METSGPHDQVSVRDLAGAIDGLQDVGEVAVAASDNTTSAIGQLVLEVSGRTRDQLLTAQAPATTLARLVPDLLALREAVRVVVDGGDEWRVATDILRRLVRLRRDLEVLETVEQSTGRAPGEAASLAAHALKYGEDADRHSAVATTLLTIGVVFVIISMSVALYGVERAISEESFTVSTAIAYCVVSVAPLLLGASFIIESNRRRRHSDEARRLHRQLGIFEAYVEVLPVGVKIPIYAAMLQRFFPRLYGDHDPFRESEWPDPTSIHNSMSRRRPRPKEGARAAPDGQ